MKEALTAAYVLDYVLTLHGLTMDYQGNLYSGGGFYMSSMSGFDTSNMSVPTVLEEKLYENGYSPDVSSITEEGTLGEFDITWGSGWMYAVNGTFANVGFCDFIPQNGDVMRIQYTLAYGSDIGSSMVGDLWFETVNRDELTTLIAQALEADVDVTAAMETVSKMDVTQDELDAACTALRTALS